LNENINAEHYLQLLQNQVPLAIQYIVGVSFNNVWFQKDGASPHFGIKRPSIPKSFQAGK